MLIRVLGSAAGGGFPQWNCGCANCRGVRGGTIRAAKRTQESVAVSADGGDWLLVNASPEIRSQIEGFAALHPRGPRESPIAAILLTNGDLDHCLGLLSLRESQPLTLFSTAAVRRGFTDGNVLYRTLERFPGQVTWNVLEAGQVLRIGGLDVQAVAAPGKLPVHLEGLVAPCDDANVGYRVRDPATGRVLAYFPGVGAVTPAVRAAIDGAGCVFFDGTFWADDELTSLGLSDKRAESMAHLPVGGPGGSMDALAGITAARRIYIHVNNTNPLLREDSAERALAAAAGWEVAEDGLEIAL